MRDALILIKSKNYLLDRITAKLKKLFVGILILLMLINIFMTVTVHGKDCATIIINFNNLLIISTTYIISYGFIVRNNSKISKIDFIKFAVQIPVSKKAIGLSRFIQIWIGFIPVFIVIIIQNISCYVKALDGFSGYIGLCTILMCCQFIILSLISGFNPFLAYKSHISKLFTFLYLVTIFIFIVIMFANIGLNNKEIYYGMFGARFVGLFEKLEFFSGVTGCVVSIISITLGYLLSYTIPNKIFGKKGWSV